MDWIVLVVSGVFEAVWASALAQSNGLKKVRETIVFIVASIISMVGLGIALNTLPTGTAYAVWTATGASITVAWAMWRQTEPASVRKAVLIVCIIACVIGLKVVA